MKIFVIFVFSFAGIAAGQNVRSQVVWPENTNTLAGTIADMTYSNLGDGSCGVRLPTWVNLFHVMNGFIVPEGSEPSEGIYKISAPTHWTLVNGTFQTLIMFNKGFNFSLDEIEFTCDPLDVADINVYSFPQNNLMKDASSTVCYRKGFHVGTVLRIVFPTKVAQFNVTTWDTNFSVETEDNVSFTITGFKAEIGNNHNTEVSFNIVYAVEDGLPLWFSAGEISVSIEEPESAPK